MNSMFKELHRHKLIYPYKGKKGRYCLSENAEIIIKEIIKINSYIDNKN